jgi:penicillin-binding protein 1C
MKPRLRTTLLLLSLLLIGLGIIGYTRLITDLPSLDTLSEQLNLPSVRITDRHGRILYEVLGQEGGRHAVVPLETIPLSLRQATIATEDRGFYDNPGVELAGIARALWINLTARLRDQQTDTLVGGSTITQQVARNLLLSPEERGQRSLYRKLREGVLAWQLTRTFSKDEILALYLNQTYYGGLTYGVEAASQTFFGKPVSQLDLAESALLAGLPQAPSLYNPYTDPTTAKKRQQVVLGLMEKAGFIDEQQRDLAEREPLIFASTPYPIQAPHFVMMVRAALDSMFTPDQIYEHGGLVVRTTLDLDWQGHAESAVERHLADLQTGEAGLGHNVSNAALVALDPHTHEILALVGSPDYFDALSGGAINMAIAPRQPGSALKPILYAAAMDPARASQGSQPAPPWTAATMLLDVSTSFMTQDGKAYTPANYDRDVHGPVLLREALASSLNIPAVITLDHIGMAGLFEQASALGITTLHDPQEYDLSLALGGGAVRLIELTAAYGAFANGGFRVTPVSILDVHDMRGSVLYSAPPVAYKRVLDMRVAWLISDILSDNDARRIGFGPHSTLRIDRPSAVKTGTTSNFHDNWTVGYTPDLVVGVWVGNTSYEPMRDVNGLTGAAPIWHQFIRTVLTGSPPQAFIQPEGMVQEQVCFLSGLLPTPTCPYRRWEWFIEGTQPMQPDHVYQEVEIDTATGHLANANTPPGRRYTTTVLDLPPEASAWARIEGLTLLSDLLAESGISASDPGLRIISPTHGSVYRLSPGMDADSQRIPFEVVSDTPLDEVSLWIDGTLLASFKEGQYRYWWSLIAGNHEVWAEGLTPDDTWVSSEQVSFTVTTEP